ncbi:MAG: DUF420 domain-containing protein [Anaerolineae bacterium]|nr:DUF420 domain-containing protein [Anaerolineae bacterium]NUQ02779.1 hypothetical protein [Anaerolineae bacterium]
MNLYLEPQGFLGTGASLMADITLVAYVLLIIPAMIIGFYFARHGKHRPHHQALMNSVTLLNWVLILLLMAVAYQFDVVDNIGRQPDNLRYLMPTVHALLGLPAQILATFIMVRMAIEDRSVAAAKQRGERNLRPYWWTHAKRVMQITMALWLATSVLGIVTYLVRYNVVAPLGGSEVVSPEATEPVGAGDEEATPTPAAIETEEAQVDATLEAAGSPVSTLAATSDPEPAETVEVGETPEAEDSGSGGN